MTFTQHPEALAVISSADLADHFKDIASYQDRVLNGFDQSDIGLNLTVTTGEAYVAGYKVGEPGDADEVVALADNDTNHVFLEPDGTLSANTTGADPANGLGTSLKIYIVTTSSGTVDTVTDLRDTTVDMDAPVMGTSFDADTHLGALRVLLSDNQPYLEMIDSAVGGESWRIWNRNGKLQLTDPSGATVYIDDISHLAQSFQQSVKDVLDFTTSEPASPTTGDRYINTGTGASSVTAQSLTANDIVEWNGVDWDEWTPAEGWIAYVDDVDQLYKFDGSTWTTLIPTGSGSGLDADLLDAQHGTYYTNRTNHSGDYENFAELGSDPATPAANEIRLYAKDDGQGTTAIFTIDSAGEVTELGSGLKYNEVTGTSQQMAAGNTYAHNNAALGTYTLPVDPGDGAVVEVMGISAGGWTIAQNAGDQIIVSEDGAGVGRTTTGVSGSISSRDDFDTIRLVCVSSAPGGSVWQPRFFTGTLDVS